jgi:cupin 2 domain-containing protein
MPERGNIFADIPTTLPEELIEVLAATRTVRIERIASMGQVSPEGFWYDQELDEWVLLLRGAAWLQFEGVEHLVTMAAGDYLQIPAHRRHRVEWTDPKQPTIWLAVHWSLQ